MPRITMHTMVLMFSMLLVCIMAYAAPGQSLREHLMYKEKSAGSPLALANSSLRPHPFGVMVSGSSAFEKAQRAALVGSYYIRPAAVLTSGWNGRDEECDAAQAAGLQLILTVRNSPGLNQASGPPADLATYKRTLGAILDRYHPALLVVENEENSVLFYTGTPEDYLRQLAAAVEVAHAKGVKVANGGLVSELAAILVGTSLEERGEIALADEYFQKTMGTLNWRKLRGLPKWNEQIKKGKTLLAGYRAAGADYVNFHWYKDAASFEEAVVYIGTKAGLPVISNELGQQRSTSPEEVTSLMEKVSRLNIPIAIWFSIDITSYAQARGLFEKDGSLRPNGEAFRRFIINTYSK